MSIVLGYIFLLSAIVFECAGHMAMSIGSSDENSTFKALINKKVILGVLCFVVYIVLWTYCLNVLPVSVAYAISSLQVVVLVFMSALFLGERLTRNKVIGSFLIALGTLIIILSTMDH